MLEKSDFEQVKNCPFCGGKQNTIIYFVNHHPNFGEFEVKKCEICGQKFSGKKLNKDGLEKYWGMYHTRVHMANPQLVDQRRKMYDIEAEWLQSFLNGLPQKILDVGCGAGAFMEVLSELGHVCYGVEFGKEAAEIASKKYKVWYGDFSQNIVDDRDFDVVIFRGVLQYVPSPKAYLDEAISLLGPDGILFITSTPNANAFLYDVYEEKFGLSVNPADWLGYSENMLTQYLRNKARLVGERYFYPETPYADLYNDALKVAEAISCRLQGKDINIGCPAYWDNMLSLIYRKKE